MTAAAVVATASSIAAAHSHAAEHVPAPEVKASEVPVAVPVPTPVAAIAPVAAPAAAAEQIVMRKPVEQLLAERQTMLDGAGLALIETDAQKWRAAYDRASSFVAPAHAPRVRRAPAPMDRGPLQQVETRK